MVPALSCPTGGGPWARSPSDTVMATRPPVGSDCSRSGATTNTAATSPTIGTSPELSTCSASPDSWVAFMASVMSASSWLR